MHSIAPPRTDLNTDFSALHAELLAFPPEKFRGNDGAKRRRAGNSEGDALGLDSSQTRVGFKSPPKTNTLQLVDSRGLRLIKVKSATLTAARLLKLQHPTWTSTFVGLTYKPGCAYAPRHITDLVSKIRMWCDRMAIECSYVWVAEMQKRGVIHYHLLVFHPKRCQFPKPDKQGWWPHGSTNRSVAIRNVVAYMAKYMSKGDVAAYPKGARTYGSGGVKGGFLYEQRWWKMPTWVRKIYTIENASDGYRRVKGGYANLSTGEVSLTPWRVIFRGGGVYIQLKEASSETTIH